MVFASLSGSLSLPGGGIGWLRQSLCDPPFGGRIFSCFASCVELRSSSLIRYHLLRHMACGDLRQSCAILLSPHLPLLRALRRTAFFIPHPLKADHLWLRHMAWAEGLVGFANRCAILLSEAPSSVASRLTSNCVLHPSSAKADHLWLRHMAWAEGFEPPTVGLEIRCSIQLSYAHVYF